VELGTVVASGSGIADFTADEVAALYGQHTADTGQEFTPEAVARAYPGPPDPPGLPRRAASQPRVRRVIEPTLAGTLPPADAAYDDDVSYVQDLGLIAPGDDLQIANPIYREVITRVFTARIERAVTLLRR
jgi:hypothetical protein